MCTAGMSSIFFLILAPTSSLEHCMKITHSVLAALSYMVHKTHTYNRSTWYTQHICTYVVHGTRKTQGASCECCTQQTLCTGCEEHTMKSTMYLPTIRRVLVHVHTRIMGSSCAYTYVCKCIIRMYVSVHIHMYVSVYNTYCMYVSVSVYIHTVCM